MKKQPISCYRKIILLLEKLHKSHPSYGMGRHLSTALTDYGNLWEVSDKEIMKALQDYQSSLESDTTLDDDIDKVIKDGLHIYDSLLNEEDDDDGQE